MGLENVFGCNLYLFRLLMSFNGKPSVLSKSNEFSFAVDVAKPGQARRPFGIVILVSHSVTYTSRLWLYDARWDLFCLTKRKSSRRPARESRLPPGPDSTDMHSLLRTPRKVKRTSISKHALKKINILHQFPRTLVRHFLSNKYPSFLIKNIL